MLDGEPNYEDHPVKPWPTWDPANGYYRDHDVRKQLYRSVFAGACGVTYGHHSMWQFYDPAKRELVNHADRSWQAALDRPGAWQAGYLPRLMLSRPYLTRIPDQTVLGYAPQGRHEHMRALRDAEGRWVMVYTPIYQPVIVRMDALRGAVARAWWFNPRTGVANEIGTFPVQGEQTFIPPADGPDWVLVVDDAAQGFGAPGHLRDDRRRHVRRDRHLGNIMRRDLVIGIDCSTTATKAIAWAMDGAPVASARRAHVVAQPHPGWHEQAADDWWAALAGALREIVGADRHAPRGRPEHRAPAGDLRAGRC